MTHTEEWKRRALALLGCGAAMWLVSLAGLFVSEQVVWNLALLPRRLDGLAGILGMPLVHGSMVHLLANTAPFLVLGGMVALRGAGYFLAATLAIAVVGGLALWLFGRNAAHIGASGLVFGYFGFLLTRGFYERSLRAVGIAAVVALFYGTMLFGILPRDDGVSWDGHLCGLLAGALCARSGHAIGRRRVEAP